MRAKTCNKSSGSPGSLEQTRWFEEDGFDECREEKWMRRGLKACRPCFRFARRLASKIRPFMAKIVEEGVVWRDRGGEVGGGCETTGNVSDHRLRFARRI